jgi:hypothetical protein
MKRRIFKLLLLLLLGAIVNVAVAWACALRPLAFNSFPSAWNMAECIVNVERNELPLVTLVMDRVGEIDIRRSLGGRSVSFAPVIDENEYEALVPQWSVMADPRIDESEFQWFTVRDSWRKQVEHACGWPCLALRLEYRSIGRRLEYKTHFIRVPTSLRGTNTRAHVPITPVFPGFAINTIFYAAVLWVLYAAPGSVRRWRRRRRGLCPACAYPVGQSPTCTECGKPITRRGVAPT